MLARLASLALLALVFASCSSGGGPGGAGVQPQNKGTYSGDPTVLNGKWEGAGNFVTARGSLAPQTYRIVVSQLPTGFDLAITSFNEAGNEELDMMLTGHRIVNGQIIDVRDQANVGAVGAGGFIIGRPHKGFIKATMDRTGRLDVEGEIEYTTDYKVKYRALLSKTR